MWNRTTIVNSRPIRHKYFRQKNCSWRRYENFCNSTSHYITILKKFLPSDRQKSHVTREVHLGVLQVVRTKLWAKQFCYLKIFQGENITTSNQPIIYSPNLNIIILSFNCDQIYFLLKISSNIKITWPSSKDSVSWRYIYGVDENCIKNVNERGHLELGGH